MPKVDKPISPLVPKLEGLHLFHFDGAPCAQRVRFALAEKGIVRGADIKFNHDDPVVNVNMDGTWTSRIVSLIKKDHLSKDYAKIQPNLVIPALVHDGVLYIESMDIVEYLDDAFGGQALIPKQGDELLQARELTALGKSLHRSIRFVTFHWGLGRLGKLNAQEEQQLKDLVKAGRDEEQLVDFYQNYNSNNFNENIFLDHLYALIDAFDSLENRLKDGRLFLAGDSLTMADVIWAMKVLRLEECGYPFKKVHPVFYQWYQRIYSRPAFKTGVMGKHKKLNVIFRMKSRIENTFGIGLATQVYQRKGY